MFVENLKETLNLGKKLSHKLNPQSIVLLKGPIGSGKTSFVQGIAKGLSISEDITSPTFALAHHYKSGKIPLIHLDLYRLENSSSANLMACSLSGSISQVTSSTHFPKAWSI